MIVLILNCGSSSIKYQALRMDGAPNLLCKGLVERVGGGAPSPMEHKHMASGAVRELQVDAPDHAAGIAAVLQLLTDAEVGVVRAVSEIEAVGHRVVHGGDHFAESVLITPAVEAQIERCFELAPLHNAANLMGIRAMARLLPGVPQVGVFDTAFHQTLPPEAYRYALPARHYEELRVRKYGFHGTSHMYVAQRAARILGRPLEKMKLITCHLGNGASITAVKHGRSVDTSMGFTPVDGLMMGTRSGSVDPGALFYIAEKRGMSLADISHMINSESGLLGVSKLSNDMRHLDAAAAEGNEDAILARRLFTYQIRKRIGAYVAVMEGVDAVVFTGGIGENDTYVRAAVCERLGYLGAEFDSSKNRVRGKEAILSKAGSRVALLVVPTDEEGMIAQETWRIVRASRQG